MENPHLNSLVILNHFIKKKLGYLPSLLQIDQVVVHDDFIVTINTNFSDSL